MGYAVIPVVVAVGMLFYMLFLTEASPAHKILLTVVVAAPFLIWKFRPQWLVAATLVHVVVSIHMLVYMKLHGYRR